MRRLLAITLAGALSWACGNARELDPYVQPESVPSPDAPSFDSAFLQVTGVELTAGHTAKLVENGAVFDEMVRLIGEAKHSIHIVLFIWRPSEPSDRVVEAILARTREGVACRVIVDPIGSTDTFDEQVKPVLEQGGCEVKIFRPVLEESEIDRIAARNHRKLLIVDGRAGLTGGWGVWRSWLGDGVSSPDNWRDTNVTVRGPAVRRMQLAFAENWKEAGGSLLPDSALPEHPEEGGARAAFVASQAEVGSTAADRMTQLVIASAKERLWISNAYFVPSEPILALLEERKRAGVDVRILAAGPVHDWKPILAAQRASYERLLAAGIRIWEYQPSMMHAKTVLVDDRLSVIGSTNLDPLSLNRMEEGSLVVEDEALADQLEASFLRDVEHAREIGTDDVAVASPYQALSRMVTRFIGRWP